MSIAQSLSLFTDGNENIFERYLFEHNGLWNSWLHSGEFAATTRSECLEKIVRRFTSWRKLLAKAHALIITFGTNRCYNKDIDGSAAVVANCHKVPEREFGIHDATVNEIIAAYSELLPRLFEVNNQLQVLFTVSPYRYAKYGFHGSNLSKSVLLLAVDGIIKRFSNQCFYFPSYEIVIDELRDYRFYASDMLHPSQQAVDYIFERFKDYAFTDEARTFVQEWQKIVNALNHRPYHPETKEYRAFVEKTQACLVALSKKYANLAVGNEVNMLKQYCNDKNCDL